MLTTSILCWGSWEPETSTTLDQILCPGMNWTDIGANVGVFTIIGHRIVAQGGRTWAFEANPKTYSLLVDNVNLNWFFTGVVTENKAVYSESKMLDFHAPVKYNVNATLGDVADGSWDRVGDLDSVIRVQAITLDEYFAPNTRMDVIKVDIEGSELFALRGAKRLLSENRHVKVLLEWSPDQCRTCGYDPSELAEEIRLLGFECQLAERDRRPMPFEELLKVQETTMLLLNRP